VLVASVDAARPTSRNRAPVVAEVEVEIADAEVLFGKPASGLG
jgi:hypothetical protein